MGKAGAFPCVAKVLNVSHSGNYRANANQLRYEYPGYIFKFPDDKYYLDGHQLMFSDDLDDLTARVIALEAKLNH